MSLIWHITYTCSEDGSCHERDFEFHAINYYYSNLTGATISTIPCDSDPFLNYISSQDPLATRERGLITANTTVYKYSNYATSAYFNGGFNYFDIANDASYNLSTGNDFTIDLWFYCNKLTSGSQILIQKDGEVGGNNSSYQLSVNSAGKLEFALGNGISTLASDSNRFLGSTTINLNQWNHAALVRYGSNVNLYLNGSLEKSNAVGTMVNGTGNVLIGYKTSGGSEVCFNGNMQEVRIVNGIAVYTNRSFTPPTTPNVRKSGQRTKKVLIVDNYFPVNNAVYYIACSPENSLADEWLEDIIVERNVYQTSVGTPYVRNQSAAFRSEEHTS